MGLFLVRLGHDRGGPRVRDTCQGVLGFDTGVDVLASLLAPRRRQASLIHDPARPCLGAGFMRAWEVAEEESWTGPALF